MEKLLKIMEEELNIQKGKTGMYAIQKSVFMNKVVNGLYNEYLEGSITGTVRNPLSSIQYDATELLFTRHSEGLVISLYRRHNNNIVINLDNVESINMSISENNWIDIHLLSSSNDNDYSSYVSIVIRG